LNDTVWSNMAANKFLSIGCSVLIGTLFLAGCCVPVPTVPHSFKAPDQEAVESFTPGATTRADVLLLLGEPKHRLDDDRFLMYEWTVAYGYLYVIGYTRETLLPIDSPEYMCFEFGSDSHLVRREHIMGSAMGFSELSPSKPDKAIRRCMKLPEEPDESDKK
jgi:hypothetical protein